uniref:Protein RADIALIS-like 3 n=1 Tax=Tanacetum cinerariifolium TaxID=118510 RepID=A0A6L2NV31_TANCI|nr:protein RADIALIS-like 3 [Tanacetum cinerariifolium]GEU88892.1 protein RADIALIS-like 3 [Tanacetum cinerariifolium]
MASSSTWTWNQNKMFENLLVTYEKDPREFQKIANIMGKTKEEMKNHYQKLVTDVTAIEAGKVPLPNYEDNEANKREQVKRRLPAQMIEKPLALSRGRTSRLDYGMRGNLVLGFPSISLVTVSGQSGTLVGQVFAYNRGYGRRFPSTKIDLFAFISHSNPTKVRIGEKEPAKKEVKLLALIECRTVLLNPLVSAASRDSGDSIEKTKKKQKRKVVGDASGSTFPPKRLMEDHHAAASNTRGKSLVTIRDLFSDGSSVPTGVMKPPTLIFVPPTLDDRPTYFVSRLNLWTCPPSLMYVVSSNDSHHSGSCFEVKSFARSPTVDVPVTTVFVTTTITVNASDVPPPIIRVVLKNLEIFGDSSAASGAYADAVEAEAAEAIYVRGQISAIKAANAAKGNELRDMKERKFAELASFAAQVTQLTFDLSGFQLSHNELSSKDDLRAGVDHGKSKKDLFVIKAYDPSAEAKYVKVMNALGTIDFSLLSELKSKKYAIIVDLIDSLRLKRPLAEIPRAEDLQPSPKKLRLPIHRKGEIMEKRLSLTDVMVPLAEPLSSRSLIGEASTFATPATSKPITTLSMTFASSDVVHPLSISNDQVLHDKDPHAVTFEKEGLDTSSESLGLPMLPLRSISLHALFPNDSMTSYGPSYLGKYTILVVCQIVHCASDLSFLTAVCLIRQRDKMLLMQAQENGVALDEEKLLFIACGQDNVDDDVDEQPVQDLALNMDNTMFMANLSPADPVYDEAGSSYDSDILSEGIQKALINEIKEMNEVFDQMEAEVDQHAVDKKCDEIERKNLLIENKNLIVKCLSKEVFFIVTNSELTVSRFTKMPDAHTVVQARCLKLEAELSKLNDKIQKDDHHELAKCFSNLEETRSEAARTLDFRALDFHITQLTTKVTVLQEQNELFRVENAKIKQHYKELYDSMQITRAKHIDQTTALNNREVHPDYLKHLKESVATLREIVEEAQAVRPLDRSLASACHYTKHSQELLEYAVGTCSKDFNKRDNKHAF